MERSMSETRLLWGKLCDCLVDGRREIDDRTVNVMGTRQVKASPQSRQEDISATIRCLLVKPAFRNGVAPTRLKKSPLQIPSSRHLAN
jgi:hypothetical protein